MKLSLDAPVFDKTNQIADVLVAGFLWLVCSVPVVTIGPASAALYYTVVKVVRRKRETVWKSFFHSFKSNLKQGILMTLLYGGYGALIAVYGYLAYLKYTGGDGMNPYMLAAGGIVLAFPWLLTVVWIFPVISRFEARTGRQLQYAVCMAVGNLPATLGLLALLLVCFVLIYLWSFLLVILPGVYAFVSSFLIERVFRKYMEKERGKYAGEEDLPWYLE
ncbi:hypothetical protein BRYFOR_05771 [Marvinbryantia formatexigens DSM 14469]|uniref:DUF624 domain-containing protein n=1 Tax=Marvinbryantia formatexigens DSM 14469 TaxID=478749 RepID=C6LAX7_9FIRM|nr:YesL family protein [Marvinbryantia formatexigens]EET62108.1 hypothetical protein BRYFOR_05771 [Marvinbryantia formatexigens DSM 14469]UWO26537.1 YesL family protein [Marvinbryantia formatexigens DSM 14469]SDF76923.1 Uncharacterized membrane protein YesL [Marvinbryantia formatexigens]